LLKLALLIVALALRKVPYSTLLMDQYPVCQEVVRRQRLMTVTVGGGASITTYRGD